MQLPLLLLGAANISINPLWHVLGPFQLGTRGNYPSLPHTSFPANKNITEAEWGSDPLKLHAGGFPELPYIPTATYASALSTHGCAGWYSTTTSSNIVFGNTTDWAGLRNTYGWSAPQFQAWARGEVVVLGSQPRRVVLYLSGAAGEMWVSRVPYFGGDYYGYRRAPVVVTLPPGQHQLDVRIASDVRAFGSGAGFTLEAVEAEGGLVVGEVVVADLVEGRVVGEWGSVGVRNEGVRSVVVVGVEGKDDQTKVAGFELVRVAPGQSRPIRLRITKTPEGSRILSLVLRYQREGEDGEFMVDIMKELRVVEHWSRPQKFTKSSFLHPSGVVSYAVLRPPSENAPCEAVPENKRPILLSLHGAGVEADSPQSEESYGGLPDLCSWLLLPSGVTTWSGDDWHRWGFADVEAAVAAIPQWMEKVNWTRQGVDLEKWVVSGHSNGGQGTWYTLTHRSDKIIAAAPLSGYLSIQAYVPYHMWHEADPRKSAMVLAALNSYRHELLTPNMRGTPILQQHGQDDDNVPVYHSRRMHQLVGEAGWSTSYREIPNKGHWWEGAMTAGGLPEFLAHYLDEKPLIPELPNKFSLVVANPADTGPRGGIAVDQLNEPDRLGRIDVEMQGSTWVLTTTNIRRWHFDSLTSRNAELPDRVLADDQEIQLPVVANCSTTFLLSDDDSWTIETDESWKSIERTGRQSGALDAFLASDGPFRVIVPPGSEDYKQAVALDVSRNLYQYFAADTELTSDLRETTGNVVLIGHPSIDTPCSVEHFPITISERFVEIADVLGKVKRYKLEAGMGAIFICPLPGQRLMLVLWGVDEAGTQAASRLLPLRTGVGQPDFILLGRESSWAGVDGAKALGMFDSRWRVSRASYL